MKALCQNLKCENPEYAVDDGVWKGRQGVFRDVGAWHTWPPPGWDPLWRISDIPGSQIPLPNMSGPCCRSRLWNRHQPTSLMISSIPGPQCPVVLLVSHFMIITSFSTRTFDGEFRTVVKCLLMNVHAASEQGATGIVTMTRGWQSMVMVMEVSEI